MSASDDKIEPADPEAIRRTWVNEKVDLDNAVNNATSEAYLNWPNEAGVCAGYLFLLNFITPALGTSVHLYCPPRSSTSVSLMLIWKIV